MFVAWANAVNKRFTCSWVGVNRALSSDRLVRACNQLTTRRFAAFEHGGEFCVTRVEDVVQYERGAFEWAQTFERQ